jgi:hypothetical protein
VGLSALSLAGCGATSNRHGACPSESGELPVPLVAADGQQVEATTAVYGFCEGGHGDGPLMFGETPIVLAATGDVVVTVRPPFAVKLTWAGEPFVTRGDGSYISPGAAPGCHRLELQVTDPASVAAGSFGVTIAMQTTC